MSQPRFARTTAGGSAWPARLRPQRPLGSAHRTARAWRRPGGLTLASSQRRSHAFQRVAHQDGVVVVDFYGLCHDMASVQAEPAYSRIEVEIASSVGPAFAEHARRVGDLRVFYVRLKRLE